MGYVLGIDIGRHGAIAFFRDRSLIDIFDMPTLGAGPGGRTEVSAALLASLVRKLGAETAFIEAVGARPEAAPRASFTFGRSRGVVEGVLAASGLATSWLTPTAWHAVVGLPAGSSKDQSIAEALRRWPSVAPLITRHDRAEAALIGVAGLIRAEARAL